MKGFRTYEFTFQNAQEFVSSLVGAHIWIEAVPVQTGMTTVIVHLRKGDNKQYRDILDICIEQDVKFDIHDYLQEEVDG
jgi:hypothetical protein